MAGCTTHIGRGSSPTNHGYLHLLVRWYRPVSSSWLKENETGPFLHRECDAVEWTHQHLEIKYNCIYLPEVTIENRKQETWAFWTKYSTRIITIQSTPVRDGFLLKLSEHVANYLLPYYPLRALGWALTEYGDSLQGLTTTKLGNKFNRGTSFRGSM